MAVDAPAQSGLRAVPALFVAAVLAQVSYPLVSGAARDAVTVVVVLLVAAAGTVHAALTRGASTVVVLLVAAAVGGFAVDVLGVHTGVPFGAYHYAGSLGPRLFGVPLLIAAAWTMLAWPAGLAAAHLARGRLARILIGGWALASWDVFLDPQMVAAGHWRWRDPALHLPGVPSVPLTDYLGWFAVSLLISAAIQWAYQPRPLADDRWPLTFYVWTWASSALALAAFLGLGAAAAWGALAMGTVAVPVVRVLVRQR